MSDVINDVPVDAPADTVPVDTEPETPVQLANDAIVQKRIDGVLTPDEALPAVDSLNVELQTMRMSRQRDLHALNRGSQCELDLAAARTELQLYKDREPLIAILLDVAEVNAQSRKVESTG